MILQLSYISTARPTLILADVENILAASRRRNQADAITGLLVFDGKRFLQVLEGDETKVGQAYQRIAADERHRAIVRLSERRIAAAEFGHWAMASHIVGPVLGDGNVVAQVDAMTADLPDANLRETLRGFARVRGG